MKHSYLNDDTCFSIDVINEILEEDFDALLNEGSKILHSIEGTILEEEIFSEFNEFIVMTTDENSESEFDTEEPPFDKITINTDYKIKTSLEEPPTDLELKPLPDNLEYVFLEEPSFLPVIISSKLSAQNKTKLVSVLKNIKRPLLGKRKTFLEVVKKEIVKLLNTGIIYPIADSPWVSPIHCVPKKGGITVVTNKNDKLFPTRTVTGWRVCIDYRKLNEATTKDHFPLPFMDQMDDFSVFGDSFDRCLNNLDKMLQRCKDAHLVLNWEKCHFMVKEGIILGHKILLLQEFDIEIKDRKGTENIAADHLSRIENEEISECSEVDDNFPGQTLMEINTRNESWFADFANYLVVDIIPKGMTYQQKNKFFSDLKHYFWEEPYLFKGIHFIRPFPKSHIFEYILVVVDYVSKWTEAQALPPNDARVVITFLKKLFCHFGIPKALISERGTHFCNKIMEKTMKRYGVNHRFSTSYHPQTSGQVENTNRALKRILEKTVKDNPAIWSRKLDHALWSFRTAYKTPTGTTPYKLIYGKNYHLSFEIEHRAYWALMNCNPDLIAAGEKRIF
ncbi:reverse transcriptase domain-containing protein [Tanacetum coccineum]|uniref:Reverse transcriptase domain-containing protein n=1 Tax=Tanacetum coccineum TaxID=301880 RepID=A0ABQ5CFR3_9ASTR